MHRAPLGTDSGNAEECVDGGGGGGIFGAARRWLGERAPGGGAALVEAAPEDEDELPWQVIAILDHSTMRDLRYSKRYRERRVAAAMAGTDFGGPSKFALENVVRTPGRWLYRVDSPHGVVVRALPRDDAPRRSKRAHGDYVRCVERHGAWLKLGEEEGDTATSVARRKKQHYSYYDDESDSDEDDFGAGELWVRVSAKNGAAPTLVLVAEEAMADLKDIKHSADVPDTDEEGDEDGTGKFEDVTNPAVFDRPFEPRLHDANSPGATDDLEDGEEDKDGFTGDVFAQSQAALEQAPTPAPGVPPPPPVRSSAALPLRTRVVLHGLSATAYNGRSGVVVTALSEAKGRQGVRLDGDTGPPVAVRPRNMRPTTGDDEGGIGAYASTLGLCLREIGLGTVGRHGSGAETAEAEPGSAAEDDGRGAQVAAAPIERLGAALRAVLRDHSNDTHPGAQDARRTAHMAYEGLAPLVAASSQAVNMTDVASVTPGEAAASAIVDLQRENETLKACPPAPAHAPHEAVEAGALGPRAARAAAQCSSETSIGEIEEGVGALQRLLADERRRLTRAGHTARVRAEREVGSGPAPSEGGGTRKTKKKRGSFLESLTKGLKGKLGGGSGGGGGDAGGSGGGDAGDAGGGGRGGCGDGGTPLKHEAREKDDSSGTGDAAAAAFSAEGADALRLRLTLVRGLLRCRRDQEALSQIEEAVAAHPTAAAAALWHGRCLLRAGKRLAGLQAFERACKPCPAPESDAVGLRASRMDVGGDPATADVSWAWSSAHLRLRAARRRDKLVRRADDMYGRGRFEEAAAFYGQALTCCSTAGEGEALGGQSKGTTEAPLVDDKRGRATLFANRAACHRRARRFDAALVDCDAALALYPRYARALFRKAAVLLEAGRTAEAVAGFEALLRVDRAWPNLMEWLVRAHAIQKRKERAEERGEEWDGDAGGSSIPDDAARVAKDTDHYSVLNVTTDATEAQLKRAYRLMSLKFHPDRRGGSTSAFQRVAAAYETLSDPKKRKNYDLGGDVKKGKTNRDSDSDSSDARDEQSLREEIERKYFPERFKFWPFGDPFIEKRKLLERRRRRAGRPAWYNDNW